MTTLDVVKAGFVCFFTWNFIQYARERRLKRDFAVLLRLKGWRLPSTLVQAWAVGAVVIGLGILLYEMSGNLGRVFQFSWLDLIATKDDGAAATNLVTAGMRIPWFGIAFVLLLAVNVPRLARTEEYVFRRGTKDWPDAIWRSVKFGFAHAIVGVPIAFCLVLCLAGIWFTLQYWKGGTGRATLFHIVHNYSILIVAGIVLLLA